MIHFIGVSYYIILCTIGCYLKDTSTEKMFFHHFHSTSGEIVKYNFIIANSNTNVYNPSSGKFTAAFDGTYIFHYYGLDPKNQVFLQIITHPTCTSLK